MISVLYLCGAHRPSLSFSDSARRSASFVRINGKCNGENVGTRFFQHGATGELRGHAKRIFSLLEGGEQDGKFRRVVVGDGTHGDRFAARGGSEEDAVRGVVASDLDVYDVYTADHQVTARRDGAVGLARQGIADAVDRDAA